jgi:integrase
MAIRIRPYRRGRRPGWEVDIRVPLPAGGEYRERTKLTVTAKTAATRWAQERERVLLIAGRPRPPRKEVPTLESFAPRFLDGHARANQQKPGGIAQKETVLRVHLVPHLGARSLDAIRTEDVQRLKQRLASKAPKTVNNVLTVLSTLLKKAVEWDVIEQMPCTIRLLKTSAGSIDFYDFDEYERLVTAAKRIDSTSHLIVLLGGDAGLRAGEMRALVWTDVNLEKRQLRVERNEWQGHITTTKGGRLRHVPMTARLAEALRAHRHLRGPRVLHRRDGAPLTASALIECVQRAARLANLRNNGPHILRHSFCSHLAMRGVPARAVQELAGHRDLSTTQRYMHLSPAAVIDAIRLLDRPSSGVDFGEILETEGGAISK